MDSLAASPGPATGRFRISSVGWVALAVAAVIYGGVVAQHMGTYAGGSDSSGYLNNARLLSQGRVHIERRTIESLPAEKTFSFTYIPLGFIPVNQREMVPTYPIGLSLLMAGFSFVAGWETGPALTMWLHAVFGVLLLFGIARQAGLSVPLASFGALLLAASPLYLFMSVQAMSDAPSLTWCAAAVFFAWRSRSQARWAVAAGFATAIAVLVRPSDLLVVLPVAICLGVDWRRWLWLAIGGAPGAVFLGVLNYALYGQVLTTGYGAVSGIFSWDHVLPSLRNYGLWLWVLLTPGLVLVLGLPWLFRRESTRLLLVLTTWILVFFVFYAFYYHTHEAWWYLRFLLPTFPPLIIVMLLAGRTMVSRFSPKSRWIAGIIAVCAVFGWQLFWSNKLAALKSGRGERVYPDAAAWARTHLPANAVIVSMQTSGAFLYYTDFVFTRWDQFDGSNFGQLERACRTANRPIYATFFPFEVEQVITNQRFPGHWKQIGAVRDVTFWEYSPVSATTATR